MAKKSKKKNIVNTFIFLPLVVLAVFLGWLLVENYQEQSIVKPSGAKEVKVASHESPNFTTKVNSNTFFSIDNDCTPSSEYNVCVDSPNKYGKAKTNPQIQTVENPISAIGQMYHNNYDYYDYYVYHNNDDGYDYYVGPAIIPAEFKGDNFYLYDARNINTWDRLFEESDCDYEGCYNYAQELPSEYELHLTDIGESYTGCPVFIAWEYDYAEETSYTEDYTWWWEVHSTVAFGWVDTNNDGQCLKIRSVACYEDSDCADGYRCNKYNVGWQDYSCVPDVEECFENSDCSNKSYVKNNQCYNGNLATETGTAYCGTNFTCEITSSYNITDYCFLGCSNNQCNEKSPTIIIMVLTIITIGTILYRRQKK